MACTSKTSFNQVLRGYQNHAEGRASEFTRYRNALQTLREALPITIPPKVEEALLIIIEGMPR